MKINLNRTTKTETSDLLKIYNDLIEKGFKPAANLFHIKTKLDSGKEIPAFLVNKKGKIFSIRPPSKVKFLKYLFVDKAHKTNPFIRIIDNGKMKNISVKSIVYLTFGTKFLDEVEEGSYLLKYKNGDTNDNRIENIYAYSKKDVPSGRKPWNKFRAEEDLPKGALVYHPGMTKEEIEKSYFFFNDFYHKVSIMSGNVHSPDYGILGININVADIPEYYIETLNERLKNSTKGKFSKWIDTKKNRKRQTVPISIIIMTEHYNKPRPTYRHNIGYKDGNPWNLKEENLFWELPSERFARINKTNKDFLNKNINRKKNKKHYSFVEQQYFFHDKEILKTVRDLGLDMKAYYEIYNHLKNVKADPTKAESKKVRDFLLSIK